MKKSILLSLLFAVLAVILAFTYFSGLRRDYLSVSDPVTVVVATQRIPQGSAISQNQLNEISVPKEYAQPRAINSIAKLFPADAKTPATYIALKLIDPGEQIATTDISDPNDFANVSNIIPTGYKAIAVNIDPEGASLIMPGSHVDILCIMSYTDRNKQEQEIAYIVANDVLVLTVGRNYLGAPSKSQSGSTNETSQENRDTVSLAVNSKQAQTIMLAQQNGTLKYIIRPPGDDSADDSGTLKLSDLVKDVSAVRASGANDSGQTNAAGQNQKAIADLLNKYNQQANR